MTEMEPCEFHELRIYGRELRRRWYVYGPQAPLEGIYRSFLEKQKRFRRGKDSLREFRTMKLPETTSYKKYTELRRKAHLENDFLSDDDTYGEAREKLQRYLAGDDLRSFLYRMKEELPENEPTPDTPVELADYLDVLETELKDERIFQNMRNHKIVLLNRDYTFMTREYPDREKYFEIYRDDIEPIAEKIVAIEKMVQYGNARITALTRKIDDAKITGDLLNRFGTAYPGENEKQY